MKFENNKFIKIKELANDVKSINFTRNAFYDKNWNEQTLKARGLYMRGDKVVARSYDKFFNLDEMPETQLRNLEHTLKFPVEVYYKENGFLGLLSWDHQTNDYFIASKSTNEGDYAKYFRDIITPKLNDDVKDFLQKNNVTMIFEVIDVVNDPHIISYDESNVILLDIVTNDLDKPIFYNYETLTKINAGCFKIKKQNCKIDNFDDLERFIKMIDGRYICEGFVIKDANNFRFKIKTAYYKYWKSMRKYVDEYIKTQTISLSEDECYNKFNVGLHWLELTLNDIYNDVLKEQKQMNVIDLRNALQNSLYTFTYILPRDV